MNRTTLRTVAPALALVLAVAARAWADCAPYISTGINSSPNTGTLLGTTTVTETVTQTVTFSAGVSGPGGAGASGSGSYTRTNTITYTYQIGHYQMSNGEIWEVDCRNYSRR
ncbi:MAG TPA: hypothetical protein VIL18_01310 [Longimicrobiales bacterium]